MNDTLNKRPLTKALYLCILKDNIEVTCFPLYPSKVTPTTISLPSNAMETNLVIG